mmetsp:Transcript_21029/g.20172  ORF Transcript_21029/g.20172 Transcript_21029/m.20172 type:complete len:92 (+) Transcript_21029:137-412(+)
MLSKKFVEELFRPQDLYTMASVRQIFEKLAHSSIMKLNTTSMNKLFDLMLMGIKFQFTSCASPDEIFFCDYDASELDGGFDQGLLGGGTDQ